MAKLKGLSNVTLPQLDVTEPDQIKAAAASVDAQTGGTLNVWSIMQVVLTLCLTWTRMWSKPRRSMILMSGGHYA